MTSAKRNIALFTSSRADFYPALPLIQRLATHSEFNLQLLVGGGHLLTSQGNTINDIKKLGFTPFFSFPFIDDNKTETLSEISLRVSYQAVDFFRKNHPELLFILGDRYELLPFSTAAFFSETTIAHISGGDVTLGAIDNNIRNAVSMLSSWHFPGTPESKERLIGMGICENNVCMCGELGIESICTTKLLTKTKLLENLGLKAVENIITCTFHPETINNQITLNFVELVIKFLANSGNHTIITTASNFDPGGEQINQLLKRLSNEIPQVFFFENLGSQMYYSLLKSSMLVIGNTSSAIFESQSFNIPAINIGERQKGRILNPNTISCEANLSEVEKAYQKALSNEFKESYYGKKNYYGEGNASSIIVDFLEKRVFSKQYTL